jgi:hypothetical protein
MLKTSNGRGVQRARMINLKFSKILFLVLMSMYAKLKSLFFLVSPVC